MAFTVHARLGRGRTVETFSAILEVGGERLDVAVKRPRPEFAKNEAFSGALLEWGEAQKDLDHDHLVAVLESGRTEDGVYVIQERVDGVTLGQVLRTLRRKRRTLTPTHALVVAERVAAALAYLADKRGHGALDPDEILVSYDGQVMVTDQRLFELRAHVGQDLLEDSGEDDPYRPPEVGPGHTPDPRSDVYAFGLILLEMMIGHPVWTAESMTVNDALKALRDFTHIGQASPELTKGLLEIIGPCLNEDPGERPMSAVPVHQALADLISRHGVTADDVGLGQFVEAILPPPETEDAPTMMVDPEQAERMAKERALSADWDNLSVMINPEIERRAQAALREPSEPAGEAPEAAPEEDLSEAEKQELVGAPVSLLDASPQKLKEAAQVASQDAPPPRRSSVSPMAPSVQKDRAHSVPNLARVAAKSQAAFDGEKRNIILIGAGAVLVLVLLVAIFAAGGGETKKVRIRATSAPPSAELWVDGTLVGETPVDAEVEAEGELLRLEFVLEGYQRHSVKIGTDDEELRYVAPLEPLEEAP